MRVWVLEMTPDYEQGTRYGVYNTPIRSWDDLFKLAERDVYTKDEFQVAMFTEDGDRGEKADVGVKVSVRNDEITLTGVYVEGTGAAAPTLAQWRDIQQVGSLLMQHAVQERGFTRVAEVQDEGKPVGIWKLRKEDDERPW